MKNISYLLLLAVLISCQEKREFKIDKEYKEAYQAFQGELHEEHFYYLSISDMFELDSASANSFGSAPENNFQLKDSTAPAKLGSIKFENDSLVFHSSPEVEVRLENDSVIDKYNLISLDHRGHSEIMFHENYSWYVNSLEDVKLLRIMNSENPEIDKFPGFQSYELTSEFIFEGKLTYYESPKIIEIPVSYGGTREAEFIGSLDFEYKGKTYSLDFMEGNFIMFGDQTALTETYGAGRYLEFETNDNKTAILDFNHAYNPPCSYSGFTTCSYPPEENWLDFEVKAGEKENLL
ncbi:DUF1684 domain-containing protein [Gramella jeungdoensis]|uniref:DUF1684 domain-containing protein n=1 Tax=Gramella jeungdoensis TaxID=708091 RepID=A0ABT0Z2X8_9FLAO|nr:DUF1684 domain-containing protein [Gramella jeungdoensis]MCM8569889.1 DUF1684 domain-containing protein [Gramella jeungdoensis]